MRCVRFLVALTLLAGFAAAAARAEDKGKAKRLLLVTDSGGFVHDSVALSEEVLKEIGPKHGFAVTCYRFTRDPDAKLPDGKSALEDYSERFRKSTGATVGKENCGRVNAETLKNFDAVLFFTTGNPLTKEELSDLIGWVKAGGAFAGTHCATDTLYGLTAYGELVGGYFDGHPWHQKVKLHVEDAHHPGAKGFKDGDEITDEIYQFRNAPYGRDRLHVILSIDNGSIDVKKGKRADGDYAVSWCHEVGKGRSFYTSLGHRKEVWKDPRFQESLLGGLKWATGQAKGDATPSAKTIK